MSCIDDENKKFQECKCFGIGYMGSKNKIVKHLIPQLPNSKYFVDLFAGGCAMTHGAMLSGKYEAFIINDISDSPSLFLGGIQGKYKDEKRWISRDDFFALKDKDPYVRYVWSFGNNGRNYMYSKEIEPYKKALWEFAVFKNPGPLRKFGFNVDEFLDLPTSYERRIEFRKNLIEMPFVEKIGSHFYYIPSELNKYKVFKENAIIDFLQSLHNLEKPQNIEMLQNLQSLVRLERIQKLENLVKNKNFIYFQKCYKEVELPKASECVIYLDPPYKDTGDYINDNFNHLEFYDWCIEKAKQGYKVFISEYWMPPERFKSVFNVEKRQLLSRQGDGKIKQEHLFVPIVS